MAETLFVAIVILVGITVGAIFFHDVVDFAESLRASVEYGQQSHEAFPAVATHVCRLASRACGLA